jgi:hypothetical protein
MGTASLAVLALTIANTLMAGALELCVENPARLDESIVQVFKTELGAILAVSNRAVTFADCRPGVITIALRTHPPEEERSALGGIRHKDKRLLPQIDLFTGPVAQILGTNLPVVLGRALARVTTHELGHWISQSFGHASCGVMMERLTAAHLMASDRTFFRLPPPGD